MKTQNKQEISIIHGIRRLRSLAPTEIWLIPFEGIKDFADAKLYFEKALGKISPEEEVRR